jgi:hypothetical protein
VAHQAVDRPESITAGALARPVTWFRKSAAMQTDEAILAVAKAMQSRFGMRPLCYGTGFVVSCCCKNGAKRAFLRLTYSCTQGGNE